MEAHKHLPGVELALAGLQAELATTRQTRDAAKPPVAQLLAAQRLADRRNKALEKAMAATSTAEAALVEATRAEREAKTAANEAKRAVEAAVAAAGAAAGQERAMPVSDGSDDTEWDALSALLTQLDALPAAIQAGNGETAWASMQTNGLGQVRSMVSSKLGRRQPTVAPVVAARVAAIQKPAAKPSGLDGLKGIFASPTAAAGTTQTTWAEKMQKAKAEADALEASESGMQR
jgi:hypothetical protein